ncbi:CD109 antigen [Eurytemora carolleeae]|uniref:CD109 antigen n=1 Tax=Eurytemora carolleeae TaxID=1294199 RepID=UPI000C784A49|nr:CD109 antigen [Eurytemora carolleeae]|eukprot:XP_023330083.1 CD109 antigen-like [Eurytemora affinis]
MEEIENKMGTLVGVQVLAEAFMTDFFYNNTQRGWSITRIIDPTLDIRFVGQGVQVFKPGMTFETQVSVKHSDQVALDPYTLEQSTLTIETKIRMENGELRSLRTQRIPKKLGNVCTFRDIVHIREYDKLFEDAEVEDIEEHDIFFSDHTEEHSEFCRDMFALEASFKEFRETGVHRIIIDTPKDAEEIEITATYIDDDNTKVTASLPVYAAYAPYQNFIHVRTSTSKIRVGEYVVFHVKMTQVIDHFDWLIISKHIILTRGREFSGSIFSHTYTFSVVVSTEMAPGFHILVYTKTDQDYLITDSRYYPVESINRHKIELSLTQRKDHTMKTVEVTCRGDPGSVFMVSSPRQSMYPNQGGNLLNEAAVLDSLNLFEDKDYHTHRVFWTVREGEAPDSVAYFPSMDYGIDSNRTLELQDLVVFTDFVSIPQTPLTRHCSNTTGLNPCMLTGCFTEDQRCNGVQDCEDGYDESNCGDHSRIKQELNFRYRLSRFSRFDDFYDNEDGEWGWFDTNIDEDHEQFLELEVPETAEEWFFTAFSVSKTYGISILNQVVPFSSYRPIWLYCEGPETVRRGETVGIRCTIFNWIDDDIEVMLNLRGSDDYEFVHV